MGAHRKTTSSKPHPWELLAVRYLSRWDRTTAQVEQFLRNKGASSLQARQAVRRLSDLKYLDDRAYAHRWLENRLARKPMGRERFKGELQAKGIADALVDRAMQDVLRGIDEDTLARRALKMRQGRGGQLSPLKAVHLLRQRGFEEETIARIIIRS